jgi:DNA polymerase-4
VFVVPQGEEADFVATLDLVDLPGVGPRFAESLKRRGLVHVRDALGLDRGLLASWFGPRTGAWLHDRIRGISRTPLQPHAEAKSVSRENTFHEDLETDDQLETELVRLTAKVCHDLRSDGLAARTVTVKLRDFDFRTRQASRTLAALVSTERAVLPVALELLRKLRAERRTGARLLGVGFTHLAPAGRPGQLLLFAEGEPGPESERDRAVARTMDRIRDRFGKAAIRPARLAEPPAHRNMIEED